MALVDDYQTELDNILALQSRIYVNGEEFSTSELRKRYPTMKAVNDRIDQLRMLIARSKGTTPTGVFFRGRR